MKKSDWLVRWNKNGDKTLNKVLFVTTVAPGLKNHCGIRSLSCINKSCIKIRSNHPYILTLHHLTCLLDTCRPIAGFGFETLQIDHVGAVL